MRRIRPPSVRCMVIPGLMHFMATTTFTRSIVINNHSRALWNLHFPLDVRLDRTIKDTQTTSQSCNPNVPKTSSPRKHYSLLKLSGRPRLQVAFFSCSSRRWTQGRSGNESFREPLDTSTWKSRVNRRWTPLTVVLVAVPILTFGLGTWQVQRLSWKRNLIEDLEHKLRVEPISLPKQVNPNVIPEFEYRKVTMTGRFDHSKEIFIESRTREGELGYHVIAPFHRDDGGDPILVNRGFIKRDLKSPASRPESLNKETVDVIGMLRKQEAKSIFQPSNSADLNQWYFVDIQELADYLGTSPVLVDAITYANSGKLKEMLSKGIPIGRSAQISLRNMHATYIVTWYGLSAITSIMAIILLRKPMSGRSKFAGVQ